MHGKLPVENAFEQHNKKTHQQHESQSTTPRVIPSSAPSLSPHELVIMDENWRRKW
jgi:hypothetical protein